MEVINRDIVAQVTQALDPNFSDNLRTITHKIAEDVTKLNEHVEDVIYSNGDVHRQSTLSTYICSNVHIMFLKRTLKSRQRTSPRQ